MIAELIPDKRISDLHRIDLAINATDLTTGKVVTFDRNNDLSIREAVLASSCIPLLFPTRRIDGNYYVDGGVFNNTPLKDALVLGATDVFVVALKPRDTEVYRQCIVDVTSYNSVYSTALRLMELIMDKIMYEDLKQARKLNEVIRVIEELDRRGEASLASDLKRAIGYEKHGRVKSIVGFHEVAPTCRLDPPGTLGFDDKKSIIGLIKVGEADGRAQLDGVLIAS